MHNVHSAKYTVTCTVYNVHCTMYILYSIHCTVYIIQCAVNPILCYIHVLHLNMLVTHLTALMYTVLLAEYTYYTLLLCQCMVFIASCTNITRFNISMRTYNIHRTISGHYFNFVSLYIMKFLQIKI